MKQLLTLIALSLFAAGNAAANPVAQTPDATRLYAGAQLGDGVAGGLLGLQLSRAYALEVRYDYLDTIRLPNTTIRSSIAGGALLGMYPLKIGNLEQPLYLFGKAGYERKTTKTTTSDPGIPGFYPATLIESKTISKRVVVGGGVQYDFSADVSGRIGANAIGHDHSVYITALCKF
jgi:hypothetical protein